MSHKMGKAEAIKTPREQTKARRKAILGSHTLAIFLKPSISDISVFTQVQDEKKQFNNNFSSINLFEMLKEVNKFMVKGTKIYESFKELRLCGWIMPYTLLITGPSEDMKVIRNAWIKRNLRSPKGYFIKDIGYIKDCVVESIPQSPFMSLTAALFDAVADLNHQNVFPTNDALHEYLRKHYSEIKTPENRVVHECLGRLIKDRRLYHNGRGYFVLHNDSVLNVSNYQSDLNEDHGTKVEGFNLSSSVTSSSPGHTTTDLESCNKQNSKGTCPGRLTEVTVSSQESPVSNDSNETSNNTKPFFKKRNKKLDLKPSKLKVLSCGIGGTLTDSVRILSNGPMPNKNDLVSDSDKVVQNKGIPKCDNITSDNKYNKKLLDRTKVKRSQSFNGKDNKKIHNKEVSFALVGSPTDDDNITNKNSFKKRSHSFGVGYSKNVYKRPIKNNIPQVSNDFLVDNTMDIDNSSTYVDIENSFVDDSLPENHLAHQPDMMPIEQPKPYEILENYTDLGSVISLPRRSELSHYTVLDLVSPSKDESLAEELKQAYNIKTVDNNENLLEVDTDIVLTSPRLRRKFGGIPYETQYVFEDNKAVNNMDPSNGCGDVTLENGQLSNGGLKLRHKKSHEVRKINQKKRNSLLFEEKRASLKVMGMV